MSIDREFVDRTGRSATWFLGSQGKSVARHILNQRIWTNCWRWCLGCGGTGADACRQCPASPRRS